MKQRIVKVNLQIELYGKYYRLVIDRTAKSQLRKHCDKCDLQGSGICYWDDKTGIKGKSITANIFCQDPTEYGRWVGYWKQV